MDALVADFVSAKPRERPKNKPSMLVMSEPGLALALEKSCLHSPFTIDVLLKSNDNGQLRFLIHSPTHTFLCVSFTIAFNKSLPKRETSSRWKQFFCNSKTDGIDLKF